MENGKYIPTRSEDFGPDFFNDYVINYARSHRDRPFFIYYTSVLTHQPRVETPDPGHPGQRHPAGLKSNLEYLDHLVGRLLASLKSDGLDDNTIVIFVGDNGTGGDGKGQASELGARDPFIARGPGLKRGVVSPALGDVTDLLPTLAQFAGAELPKDKVFDGKSMVPLLRGATERHRDWIYAHYEDGRVLRDSRWLLEIPAGGKAAKFFDCGENRDGASYKNVTASTGPEVKTARERFASILATMPEPKPNDAPGAGTKKKKKP
jgi:arylsulfatase A